MTKLQRKIKLAAKRRSHKKNVQKRKEKRAEEAEKQKREKEEERLEAEVAKEAALMDGDNEAARRATEKLEGMLVERPHEAKAGKKKLSQKQLKRKLKGIEKGEARSAQIAQKVAVKARRVHQRAVVRNQEVTN